MLSNMFRLVHLSDIHVWSDHARLEWGDLLSKRVTGYLNLRFRRGSDVFPPRLILRSLQDACEESRADGAESGRDTSRIHAVVTGDITNLSMPQEMSAARDILRQSPLSLSVIPGNHDAYTSDSTFVPHFQEWMQTGDARESDNSADEFRPFVHIRGPVMLLGLNTAYPTPPLIARGFIGPQQWQQAEELMSAHSPQVEESSRATGTKAAPMLRVILMHHPPMERGAQGWHEYTHELDKEEQRRVADFADRHGFDLILHGHMHQPFQGRLNNARRTLVVECGSSTFLSGDARNTARYNVYHVDPQTGKLVAITARVYRPASDDFESVDVPIPPV